jgi:Na+/citrate or Na+/malate symporter
MAAGPPRRLFVIVIVVVVVAVLAGAVLGGRYAMHLGSVRAIGAGLCTAQPGST